MTEIITNPTIKRDMTVHGTTATNVSFPFAGSKHSFTVNIPRKLHEGARKVKRGECSGIGMTDHELCQAYFESFVLDKEQDEVYEVLLDVFKQIKREKHLNDDEYVELLAAYVQSIPYDKKKAKWEMSHRTIPQHHNFVAETIADGTGICSDKSLLLCGLLERSGYGTALLCFQKAEHAVAGVAVPDGMGYFNSNYAIIETTNTNRMVGEGRGLGEMIVYPIGNGKKKYHGLGKVDQIKSRLTALVSTNNLLKKRIEDRKERAEKLEGETQSLHEKVQSLEKELEYPSRHTASELAKIQSLYKNLHNTLRERVPILAEEFRKVQEAINAYNTSQDVLKHLDGRAVDSRTMTNIINKAEHLLKQAEAALA